MYSRQKMYSLREVVTVLGVKPSRLRGYLRSGLVAPARGDRGELRFTFQDLVLLRKAEGLVTPRIPPHRVQDALRRIRDGLGEGVPLSGVQLEADGRQLVASDGQKRWEPASGQVVFDFGRTTLAHPETAGSGELHELRRPVPPPPPLPGDEASLSADDLYERGYALEEAGDSEGAMIEYRRAIDKDPRHADAHVNIGRLLHEATKPFEALAHYRAALEARPDDWTAAFNLGVALEDLSRVGEAIAAYHQALAIEPSTADAHYNLARLYEQTGQSESAIRHLLIYRRLTRKRR
jgi:tetratricopeptide (TPR) repeat protein